MRYRERESAAWPVDIAQPVSVADLQAAGLLPSDFALRETAPGTSQPVSPFVVGNYSGCNMVQPTLLHAPATCPAGQVQVATWPMCAPLNPNHPRYVAYPSEVGTMTSGVRMEVSPPKIICSPELGPSCVTGECSGSLCRYNYLEDDNFQHYAHLVRDRSYSVVTSINSGEMVEGNCAGVVFGENSGGVCNTSRPNAPAYGYGALFGTPRFSGGFCTQTNLNNVIVEKGADAMNALCCTPR